MRQISLKIKILVTLWLVLIAGLVITGPLSTKAETGPELENTITRMNANFSGTVLVARSGTVLLEKALGNGINPATRLRIGSVTKQFTAVAILQLAQQEKLTLDDPLCNYIKNCPVNWQPVKLYHLLTHTSGISNGIDTPEYIEQVTKAKTIEEVIPVVGALPLDFLPGERFNYSNPGYVLLGYVIEKASGQPYGAYIQQQLLQPLGMTNTGFDCEKDCAKGFTTVNSQTVIAEEFDQPLLNAAGGLYSTASDLYRWNRAFEDEKILSFKWQEQMFRQQVGDSKLGYGFGWYIFPVLDRTLYWHGGSLPGFSAFSGTFRDDKLTVVVLSNNDTVDTSKLAIKLAQVAFNSEVMSASRGWVWVITVGLWVIALVALVKLVRQTWQRRGSLAWKASLLLAGWVPFFAGLVLLVAAFAWTNSPWRWEGFGPFLLTRVTETIIPLVAGLQAAFILSPTDEPALEVLLACPRPPVFILIERLALVLVGQGSLVLGGSLAGYWLSDEGNLGLMLTRAFGPLLVMIGLGLFTTIAGRLVTLSISVIILLWFAMLTGFDGVVVKYPFLWPWHVYLQPDSVPATDYYGLNRLMLVLLGAGLIALAIYLVSDEERLLFGRRAAKQTEGRS